MWNVSLTVKNSWTFKGNALSCGLPNIESPQVHEISNPKSASEHEMCAEFMHIPTYKLKEVSNTMSGSNEDVALTDIKENSIDASKAPLRRWLLWRANEREALYCGLLIFGLRRSDRVRSVMHSVLKQMCYGPQDSKDSGDMEQLISSPTQKREGFSSVGVQVSCQRVTNSARRCWMSEALLFILKENSPCQMLKHCLSSVAHASNVGEVLHDRQKKAIQHTSVERKFVDRSDNLSGEVPLVRGGQFDHVGEGRLLMSDVGHISQRCSSWRRLLVKVHCNRSKLVSVGGGRQDDKEMDIDLGDYDVGERNKPVNQNKTSFLT
eukprot:Gb_25632 [translate_table: standard]